MMTMIDAVALTLGLCVGFSFADITKLIFKYIELGFYSFSLGKSNITQVNEAPSSFCSLEKGINDICKSNETLLDENIALILQLKNLRINRKCKS